MTKQHWIDKYKAEVSAHYAHINLLQWEISELKQRTRGLREAVEKALIELLCLSEPIKNKATPEDTIAFLKTRCSDLFVKLKSAFDKENL